MEWVVLSGGEALMHSNLWALCEQLKELRVKITLLSTGLLLKRNAENVVKWCDEVVVSLDGSTEVHDAIRNVPRAFERLAEGVASIKALDPGVPRHRPLRRPATQLRRSIEHRRCSPAHRARSDFVSGG